MIPQIPTDSTPSNWKEIRDYLSPILIPIYAAKLDKNGKPLGTKWATDKMNTIWNNCEALGKSFS